MERISFILLKQVTISFFEAIANVFQLTVRRNPEIATSTGFMECSLRSRIGRQRLY